MKALENIPEIQNDITDGIDFSIRKAIEKAIDNNSLETFKVLKDFINQILYLSIRNGSLKHFHRYIFFPANYYNLSYRKAKQNIHSTELYKYCSEEAARQLHSIIWIGIDSSVSKSDNLEEKKLINTFYYWTFNGFSALLYSIIKNEDINQFHFAMDEYDQITNKSDSTSFNLKLEIRDLERLNKNGKNDEKIKEKKEEYEIVKAFDDYKRHVLIGIKYWVIFLYRMKKLNEEIASKFINRLKIYYIEPEDLIDDLLLFGSNEVNYYFGWGDWDYLKRHSGIVYSPPRPYEWLNFGFFVDQIREHNMYLNVNELNVNVLSKTKHLYDKLKGYYETINQDFDYWKNILGTESTDKLNEKSNAIIKVFAKIKKESLTGVDKEIAEAPLYQPYIDDFKKITGNAWKSQARIHWLFETMGSMENVTNTDITLKMIGRNVFFEKAKMMFVENHHDNIYGIERMGGEIGRWEDDAFFDTILKTEHNKVDSSKVVEAIDLSIKYLNKKAIKPTLIIMPSKFTYKDIEFRESSRFKKNINANVSDAEFSFFPIGTFDDIPIYTSFSSFLSNKILVCNFADAFQMRYKTNPTWFEEKLAIDVKPVDDAYAALKLKENKQKWKTIEGGELTDEEAITLIMTSVIMDMWLIVDFEVTNNEAYTIANINTLING